MPSTPVLVLTCEHGGNRVPVRYAALFRGHRRLLDGHRGFDRGALRVARELARRLQVPLFASTTTRLLVELNRSPGHRALFSEVTRDLDAERKQDILRRHYEPHRRQVEREIARRARRRPVVHVAVHSFTPQLEGVVRPLDVGLLYDPARRFESRVCAVWKAALEEATPSLRVRRNQPYRGVSDGFTTWLRRRHADHDYAGIELELNQSLLAQRPAGLNALLADTLRQVMNGAGSGRRGATGQSRT